MNDVQSLLDRIDYLEEEIRQLREDLAPENNPFIGKFDLTRQQAAMLLCLYKSEIATTENLDAVTEAYAHKYTIRASDDSLVNLRSKVIICKLRSKLKPYRVTFRCVWGIGYAMDTKSKAKLKKILEKMK
jgi:hypothetical protein